MRPDYFLASGHKSNIGLQVLACIRPLVTAAEVIFKANWPELYKTYTDFQIKPENRVGIWPQAQFLKNVPGVWHKDKLNWHGGINLAWFLANSLWIT